MERFLENLRAVGIQPGQVITDGSALYPAVIAAVWPTAAHQLCLFHETRPITKAVLQVAAEVRRRSPTTPVVLVTGWGSDLDGKAPPAGVTAVISKPFRLGSLVEAVRSALRGIERPPARSDTRSSARSESAAGSPGRPRASGEAP